LFCHSRIFLWDKNVPSLFIKSDKVMESHYGNWNLYKIYSLFTGVVKVKRIFYRTLKIHCDKSWINLWIK
jgi:hypothetical protein